MTTSSVNWMKGFGVFVTALRSLPDEGSKLSTFQELSQLLSDCLRSARLPLAERIQRKIAQLLEPSLVG